MASPRRRRPQNVPGALYVDETCIDCDTCRWMAPAVFDRSGEASRVHAQPVDDAGLRRALQALVACPTGSIGLARDRADGAPARSRALPEAVASFPLPLDGPVHHCGYHHPDSFGATSYLIVRPHGNVLVDSPRFAGPLVRRLEQLGGVAWMLLTHRDDVGDHARFAEHFGCRRVLHERDAEGALRAVECRLEGEDPVSLDEDLVAIPVPGHTEGSVAFLHAERHLFTGDHLAWSPRLGHLYGFRHHCWHDWRRLIASTRRLSAWPFTWVLPGHGRRAQLSPGGAPDALETAVAWMESVA